MASSDAFPLTVTGSTRLYGIMGYPIAHSLSPLMQTFALRHHQLDGVYLPFAVPPEQLAQAVAGARALGLGGFNVTIPHKETIMPYLDDITPTAQAIGAVNTVHIREGRTVGYNTDGEGFLQPLRALALTLSETSVCLLGAGGAARAVAMALLAEGCTHLVIANRTYARGDRLAVSLREHFPGHGVEALAWTEAADAVRQSGLVINATSVGLHHAEEGLVPEACFQPGQVVYDLVYRPFYTPFLETARRHGATVLPGIDMLIGQGAAAFQIWTGLPFPTEDVRRLLQPFLTVPG